jgi:hypothetical protein
MKARTKPIGILASTAILLSTGLFQTAHAQSTLIESGTASLADVFGVFIGPDAVQISYFVLENNVTDLYTYGYNILNPAGDVVLNPDQSPTTTPEVFSTLTLTFNPEQNAIVATVPVGGTFKEDADLSVTWTFPTVAPGASSALLAFQSPYAPTMGNASVGGGATPPSPWSSINGQLVPVPHAAPEPSTTALVGLGAMFLLPFHSKAGRLFRRN